MGKNIKQIIGFMLVFIMSISTLLPVNAAKAISSENKKIQGNIVASLTDLNTGEKYTLYNPCIELENVKIMSDIHENDIYETETEIGIILPKKITKNLLLKKLTMEM